MKRPPAFTWHEKSFFVLGILAATSFFTWAGMLSLPTTGIVNPAHGDQDFGVNLSVSAATLDPTLTDSYDIFLQSSDGNIACLLRYEGIELKSSVGSCTARYYYPTSGQVLSASFQGDGVQLLAHGWTCTATKGVVGDRFTIGNQISATQIEVPFVTDTYALLPAPQKDYAVDCSFVFENGFDFALEHVTDGDPIFTVARGDSLSIPFNLDILYGEGDNSLLGRREVFFELVGNPPFSTTFDVDSCLQDCLNALNVTTKDTTPLGTYPLSIEAFWPNNPADPTFEPYIVKDLPFTIKVIEPSNLQRILPPTLHRSL